MLWVAGALLLLAAVLRILGWARSPDKVPAAGEDYQQLFGNITTHGPASPGVNLGTLNYVSKLPDRHINEETEAALERSLSRERAIVIATPQGDHEAWNFGCEIILHLQLLGYEVPDTIFHYNDPLPAGLTIESERNRILIGANI